MKTVVEGIWKILISLRLAVILLVTLAVSLMTATFIESGYDSETARYFIYRATWFYGLLTFLGLNILAVAISRWPWRWRHTPFLLAHAGILTLLTGSWITYVKGLDGNIRIAENEVTSAVELDSHVVSLSAPGANGDETKSFALPWMPTVVAEHFKPIELKDYGLQIDRYLSDAESKISFPAVPETDTAQKTGPAVQFRIVGAPMGGAPEVWLWGGDPGWSMQKMGLARFLIRREDQKDLVPSETVTTPDGKSAPEARFDFVVMKNGKLRYEAVSIRGEKKSGEVDLTSTSPQTIDPGWKMPIKVQFKKFVLHAINQTDFNPAGEKSGMGGGLPSPAIHLSLLNVPESKSQNSLWLGMGDRAEFARPDGSKVSIGYFPKVVVLPFALRLKKFEVQHDPGTNNAAAYVSHVQVVESLQKDDAQMNALPLHEISMNEPLTMNHYTFYQASFIPDFPRPTTTVLSVNYDPGRSLKYTGSLLLVFGCILLFTIKSFGKKKPLPADPLRTV